MSAHGAMAFQDITVHRAHWPRAGESFFIHFRYQVDKVEDS